jgi:arginine N-succinyltransferase
MHHEPRSTKAVTAASRSPEFVIRAAEIDDLPDFIDLAVQAGAGFTSLPANESLLAERLHGSKPAFAGDGGVMTLALEDRDTGRVVGCAAIKSGGGARSDFLNFLVSADHQSLTPTSLYADLTEVGSLLIHPDYRQFGAGRWLAQSRYLVIAGDLQRFGDYIFSELRGVIDDNNCSPFYDGVLAPYFRLTYEEADHRSAHGRQAELNAMLPTAPIPMGDVGEAARAAVACPHRDGQKALWFLEDEGFRFEGAVDLLDGGPLVSAPSRYIRTIRASFMAKLMPGRVDQGESLPTILAAGKGDDFRSCKGPTVQRDGMVICDPDLFDHLRLEAGGEARVCPDPRRRSADGRSADAVKVRESALCPS